MQHNPTSSISDDLHPMAVVVNELVYISNTAARLTLGNTESQPDLDYLKQSADRCLHHLRLGNCSASDAADAHAARELYLAALDLQASDLPASEASPALARLDSAHRHLTGYRLFELAGADCICESVLQQLAYAAAASKSEQVEHRILLAVRQLESADDSDTNPGVIMYKRMLNQAKNNASLEEIPG